MSTNVKHLYRSRTDRWFAGVCGGLGHYFGIDPTLVRALFVLFGLVVGGGILAYLLLWLIIPLEPEEAGQPAGESTPAPAETEQE
jgi:phage shock protein C